MGRVGVTSLDSSKGLSSEHNKRVPSLRLRSSGKRCVLRIRYFKHRPYSSQCTVSVTEN